MRVLSARSVDVMVIVPARCNVPFSHGASEVEVAEVVEVAMADQVSRPRPEDSSAVSNAL